MENWNAGKREDCWQAAIALKKSQDEKDRTRKAKQPVKEPTTEKAKKKAAEQDLSRRHNRVAKLVREGELSKAMGSITEPGVAPHARLHRDF